MPRAPLPLLNRFAGFGEALASDGDLLERFVASQDDGAFTELVRRYSRLVWAACRQLLLNEADAEDAFQATFLALAQSARSIRAGDRLGPWLHAVAHRICSNSRRAAARRTKRERGAAASEDRSTVADSTWDRAAAALHEEIHKLPESQRVAFVLCCIEGIAPTVAAEQLGLKWGTFSARLSRAKQRLVDRLSARGFGAAFAVSALAYAAPAAASLVERAIDLGSRGTAIPASIQSLASGVGGMFLKTKMSFAVALLMIAFGTASLILPANQLPPALPVSLAAPVPAESAEVKSKKLDELWTMLLSPDEAVASRALLELASRPKGEVTIFLGAKLPPLKVTKDRAEKLVAELGDDKVEVAQKAFDALREFDPRMILTVEEMLKNIPEGRQQLRLMSLLIGAALDSYDNCKLTYRTSQSETAKSGRETCGQVSIEYLPGHAMHDPLNKTRSGTAVAETVKEVSDWKANRNWIRATRAVMILEHLGTADAIKVLEVVATGHADASPTIAAKEALARLKKK